MNAKMKVLSLALIASFGYVGAAAAACPAGPDQANGGAWTAAPVFQGTVAIATPGYMGTECRLDSAISAGASGAAFATVQDDTPAAEARYRAQFSVDVSSLTNQSLLAGVQIFSATSEANGAAIWFSVFGDGAGNHSLGYFVADSSQPSGIYSNATPLAAGVNTVEFDLQIGASGSVTLWVNNNVEGSPTVPAHGVNNSAIVGIDTAFLGLAAPAPQYVTAFASTPVGFDQFDSRRQTFIGF